MKAEIPMQLLTPGARDLRSTKEQKGEKNLSNIVRLGEKKISWAGIIVGVFVEYLWGSGMLGKFFCPHTFAQHLAY